MGLVVLDMPAQVTISPWQAGFAESVLITQLPLLYAVDCGILESCYMSSCPQPCHNASYLTNYGEQH
jgi:hypothetical protein